MNFFTGLGIVLGGITAVLLWFGLGALIGGAFIYLVSMLVTWAFVVVPQLTYLQSVVCAFALSIITSFFKGE